MNALVTDDFDQLIGPRFVTEFDAIPGFWNYLVSLNRNDLIAELIQNDLDQGATRTVVSFERNCLVCEGNGKPVDAPGWQRLRKIMGAGDEVLAKRSSFGVKNHGLKTAFTIGDEIRLMSDGHAIVQTLYAKGHNGPPHPGASEHPMEDRQAPATGCRVIVRYRVCDLEPKQGEAIKLSVPCPEEIDALFRTACVNAPEQFAGVVSPETAPKYEIVLRHWQIGEARFLYSCTRPRKLVKRIEVFRRSCLVSGTLSPLPEGLHEQAVRRLAPLKGVLKERVADFFRRGRRYFVEASWPIDTKGKPKIGTGKFRYPIGYPLNSQEARTGHGANFNAPFVSNTERHAPVRHESTFAELYEECESLLIDALASNTIPQWRVAGLNPVVPNGEYGDDVVRPILAKLVQKKALPIINWREAAEIAVKGKKAKLRKSIRSWRISRNARRYRFVVPALTWTNDAVNPLLSLVCPRSEMQLDPRTPKDIIRLLADGKASGFLEEFITFDEKDTFYRVTDDGNKFFDRVSDLEREFSEPFIAQVYLDLVRLGLDVSDFYVKNEDALVESLLLPDIHGIAAAFSDLYSSALLPPDIPGLRLPPILNPGLIGHPLFRRNKWKLQKFTISDFLDSGALQTADGKTRRLFWDWLFRNGRHIARRDRPKLADLSIWPDEDGELCKISDLCEPRNGRVKAVLTGFIRQPHAQVRHSKLASARSTARTSIRHIPTEDELSVWLDTRMAQFEVGSRPDAAAKGELRRFEADLAALLKDKSIAPLIKAIEVVLPALARDGHIRRRTELVIPSSGINRMALPCQFLLNDQQQADLLDRLSPALNTPTPAMLLEAFAEDADNVGSLLPRLKQIIDVSEPDSDERRKLAAMAIIPVDEHRQTPSVLAFAGNKGNYWGGWKIRISTRGLSQNDQSNYRAAGVTSASPSPETSHSFFVWLSTQDECIVRQHIPCVLRHILHPKGPTHWAYSFTDTPFIPVKSRDSVRLVSLQTVRRKQIFLSDAGDIGNEIMQRDAAVLFAIHQVREVKAPISKHLISLGVRSLREKLKEPESVAGTGKVVPVDEHVRIQFDKLRSSRFRRTFRKRVNELGIDFELVRHDWQDRLKRVREICFADELEARHRFRNKLYRLEVDAGFDPGTGVFRMKRGLDTRGLYESVARQLVFKPTARPIDLCALERALELEIADPSFGRPTNSEVDDSDDESLAEDSDGLADGDEEKVGLGEVVGGHSPFTPDPERNRPKPGPISTESVDGRVTLRRTTGNTKLGRGESQRQTTDLEKKHREELIHNHYVSHCQMCLCKWSPQELAPIGSYIESEEVRRNVVDAHHADLVAAGGARHAGNLILLCKLHHENYGRQFTRAGVTAALRDNSKRVSISFGKDSNLQGRQCKYMISGTGEVVKLFFTDHHIQYWLSQVREIDQ